MQIALAREAFERVFVRLDEVAIAVDKVERARVGRKLIGVDKVSVLSVRVFVEVVVVCDVVEAFVNEHIHAAGVGVEVALERQLS